MTSSAKLLSYKVKVMLKQGHVLLELCQIVNKRGWLFTKNAGDCIQLHGHTPSISILNNKYTDNKCTKPSALWKRRRKKKVLVYWCIMKHYGHKVWESVSDSFNLKLFQGHFSSRMVVFCNALSSDIHIMYRMVDWQRHLTVSFNEDIFNWGWWLEWAPF